MSDTSTTIPAATSADTPNVTATAPTQATPVAADAPEYVHHGNGEHSHKRHHHGRHHHHKHTHAGGEQAHSHDEAFWKAQVQRHEEAMKAQGAAPNQPAQ